MKPFFCTVLVCLLLCGCAAGTPEPTEVTRLSAVEPTEPPGSYAPDSGIELATDGAVRLYPQDLGNIRMIKAVGADLLVISDRDTTTVTRLTGENLVRTAQFQLDPGIALLQIREDSLACFDANTRELVFLNQIFLETGRMALPAELLGEPVLTADQTRAYYCSADGVRCLEIGSGISRLVKEMSFANQYVTGLHMGDTVLQVEVQDGDGNRERLFLNAKTGALLGALPEDMQFCSGENWFYAIDPEGTVNQMLFGTGEEVWQLVPENYLDAGIFLPDGHSAVVFTHNGTMDYYDLSSGKRTGSLALDQMQISSPTVSEQGYLYFVYHGTAVCRWDVYAAAGDDTVYTDPWYSFAEPDRDGLERCRAYAERLSQRFGLEIRLVTEAVNLHPEAHDLIPEYQVPVIWDALTRLETLLGQYPVGMFAASVEGLENGGLTLLLVRDIRGSYPSGNPDSVDGLHFWQDSHSYVALAMDGGFKQNFHHVMFHALETRLLSQSIALYRWDELNPKGFAYDNDYLANQNRDGSCYLERDTRSFIDTYAMSFPKEDRARVMEYACMPGNEDFFVSYTMQKKLRALCEGIREAYDLQDYPEALLWEQYLETPICP